MVDNTVIHTSGELRTGKPVKDRTDGLVATLKHDIGLVGRDYEETLFSVREMRSDRTALVGIYETKRGAEDYLDRFEEDLAEEINRYEFRTEEIDRGDHTGKYGALITRLAG